MNASQVHIVAQQLLETYGSRAVSLAAQKAQELDRDGDSKQAQDWRRIEAALVVLSGPSAS